MEWCAYHHIDWLIEKCAQAETRAKISFIYTDTFSTHSCTDSIHYANVFVLWFLNQRAERDREQETVRKVKKGGSGKSWDNAKNK